MSSIAIVTDTDCSLPTGLAARHGIRQVPITVHFGLETYHTGVDIDDIQAFARIDRENRLPTTSAPSPGAFADAYKAAFDGGAEAIVCFTVSGEVSATYSAACMACDLFQGRQIRVVDTRTLTLGQGFMVLAAAEAAEAGAGIDEIVARAKSVGDRAHMYAALSTLKYLAMSGRVGHLAAGMASLLSVKPILTIRDGKLDLLEKVRSETRAWDRAVQLMVDCVAGRPIERMGIVHVAAPDAAGLFQQRVCSALPCPGQVLTTELTPGLSVHGGAGMVGVVVVTG